MIQRCENPGHPAYKNYGGRGIKVCPRWRGSFNTFLADVGLRPSAKHSIDRYPDNNGNYEPGNARWGTRKEQNDGRRTTRWLTFNGMTLTLTEWADRTSQSKEGLWNRLNLGWTIEDALTLPLGAETSARTQKRRSQSNAKMLTHKGRTQNVTAWAEELGVSAGVLYDRIRYGWSDEKIFSKPIRKKGDREPIVFSQADD